MPDPAAVTAPLDVLFGPLEPAGPRVGADTGEPMMSSLVIHAHGSVEVGVWECTPGGWAITDRANTETVHVLGGAGTITDADGTVRELGPGVTLVLPLGWSGRWDITRTLRKLYVTVEGA
ncbi:MAG TPA: cupin domain-containing protein [Candidatus Limnocylindrales bacterium]|nr:cupin domain-containing protein [Candidatus Limnocylindrales bacterium]